MQESSANGLPFRQKYFPVADGYCSSNGKPPYNLMTNEYAEAKQDQSLSWQAKHIRSCLTTNNNPNIIFK